LSAPRPSAGRAPARPARAGLSIRARALLASLVLLAIPFVGYGYVREIERVLQAAQEQAVIATARAVATALHDRPRLLERRVDAETSGAAYPRGTTVAATQEIELIIRGLRRAGSRIWVIDQDRRLLVFEGSLRPDPRPAAAPDLWDRIRDAVLGPLFALLLERPREDFDDALPEEVLSGGRAVDNALTGVPATRWRETADKRAVILAAAHPIWNGPEVIGAVVVEESTNRVLSLRNRAFEQLLTTTLAVFVLGALVLFLFASRLARRLVRLRDEAEQAIDARGRVHRAFRAERDRDEIGDLSRSFATVLDRLAEYNDYLERMADRLSHELRTPIAVVSSSLDNLRSAPGGADAQVYVQRAEEGVRRLNAILTRMSEARRLAESLKGTERERFDLVRVVSGCVAGYRTAFPQQRFDLRLPAGAVELVGAPDLVAQLLDKLADNAREFSAPGEAIEVALDVEWDWARLSVSNVGPGLPDAMAGQLFESMVSVRPAAEQPGERPRSAPHLGLGLFIVRLIAEFHGGRAAARNRPDGRGVTVEVAFPLAA
jgi:dedicated sortase system histidine kinase